MQRLRFQASQLPQRARNQVDQAERQGQAARTGRDILVVEEDNSLLAAEDILLVEEADNHPAAGESRPAAAAHRKATDFPTEHSTGAEELPTAVAEAAHPTAAAEEAHHPIAAEADIAGEDSHPADQAEAVDLNKINDVRGT